MPRYDTGLYQDTMGRLSDYVKHKLSPDVVEQITSDVDRNIFGGKVTLPKIVRFGQSLMNKTKGAFENYANRQSDIQQQLSQAYQTGQVSPQLSSELMGNFPMGAEVKGLYHGSPYKFNKFAQEKIGTGEGAQAFGYGHYLTESPDIAQDYAKTYDPKNLARQIVNTKGNETEAINYIIDTIQNNPWEPKHDLLQKAFDEIKTGTYKQGNASGYLYNSTVNKGKPSSADVFLEWDKLSDDVINKVSKQYEKEFGVIYKPNNKGAYPQTGDDIYNYLSQILGSPQEATNFLSRAGITGIKYPSGTLSGIKNSSYYNYVIFNPEDITIEAVK